MGGQRGDGEHHDADDIPAQGGVLQRKAPAKQGHRDSRLRVREPMVRTEARSVRSHRVPRAQPARTSVAQCTPRYTRDTPTRRTTTTAAAPAWANRAGDAVRTQTATRAP